MFEQLAAKLSFLSSLSRFQYRFLDLNYRFSGQCQILKMNDFLSGGARLTLLNAEGTFGHWGGISKINSLKRVNCQSSSDTSSKLVKLMLFKAS